MGSTSEKSPSLVEDQDYHILMVKKGELARAGWLTRSTTKGYFDAPHVNYWVNVPKPRTEAEKAYRRMYYLYKGPKPDKKWGPVCP